ncbi:YciI family protein [Thermoflavimicrobium dichotomicum]|uniref:Uncharacterized conserved protein YciI, contains a putative active-site phosphohistidine n=1 Tax=Thermoflavimicrobium dichotomicum TaxID=46223 RepID=A0A1I3LIP9_9BACL|nr:YciI family protein [Thermoflavimicrobium dichotomicum]SFI84587.1 Uncharacterized conserved protein YciI, contains a putative active-site phosphohistidine [Thermoflavimicrobium dichotomicum]
MQDPEKNQTFRPHHLAYLDQLQQQGKIFAKGPFADGSGGMIISYEEARQLAENDPYVVEGVRRRSGRFKKAKGAILGFCFFISINYFYLIQK